MSAIMPDTTKAPAVAGKAGFQSAARVQTNWTAAAEKRVLIWLAHRMPAWVNSDHLTLLGVLAMVAAGVFYWRATAWPGWLVVVNVLLVVNWFGDSLDGTLARVRNRQRPRYGFYVDHVVDIVGASSLLGGLALSGYMQPLIALAMLVAWLLLSAEVYLATYAIGRFEMSFGWFGPTETRIVLAIGNFVLLVKPHVHLFGRYMGLFDVGGIVATIAMLIVFTIATWRHTAQLWREEKLD
jgi:phosphatidylglycerophosphate synthase